MRLKVILFVIAMVVMIATSGCLNYRSDDPYNRFYPKRPVWFLKDGDPDPDRLLSYDSVYTGQVLSASETYRFWRTGQLMIHRQAVLDTDAINSFKDSGIGYYKIRDDVVRLEFFGDVDFGTYGVQRGYLDQDGNLVITHFGLRVPFLQDWNLHRLPEPWVFIRTPADLKELTPDW